MSNKVADWFITPLEAHFEAQPTDGGRITILDDMEGYSVDQLKAAVEWLKRNRQSVKTFPSPKECLKAITAVAASPRAVEAMSRAGRITRETYAECALAYNAGRTEVPVVKREDPEWAEWQAYWNWLGCDWLIALTHDRDSWTVPAHFPSQFDPRFNSSKAKRAA